MTFQVITTHRCVYLGHHPRSLRIVIVVFQQQLACLLVERRLCVGHYKQALDGQQNVFDAQVRLPVLLECVDADFSVSGHVRMEDLGEEERLWRALREVLTQN